MDRVCILLVHLMFNPLKHKQIFTLYNEQNTLDYVSYIQAGASKYNAES